MVQQSDRAPAVRHRSSLAALVVFGAVLLGAVGWHFAAVILATVPPNHVSHRYAPLVSSYVDPELDQNWKLFAPDPPQETIRVQARVRTTGGEGPARTGRWLDLSASDLAAMRGTLPSHAYEDVLPMAWSFYQVWHTPHEKPLGSEGRLSTTHLKRAVLQRLMGRYKGEQITGLQVRCRTDQVPPPPWDRGPVTARRPDYRVLPWWPVRDRDHERL
ncbi:DUF5819 family protein [Streptomyces sp. NPDC020845]|uniref:DUF5819 family protein n=1 Tax=Streptomyces sp. NPDC020845 TaxID=3365096 RepID=UPI00378E69D3